MTHSALLNARRSASARPWRTVSAVVFAALGGLAGCGTILGIEPGVFTPDGDAGGEAGASDGAGRNEAGSDAPRDATNDALDSTVDLEAEAGPQPDASDASDATADAEAGLDATSDASDATAYAEAGLDATSDASDATADAEAGLDATSDAEAGPPEDASPGLTLALGQNHACALFPDGAVDCWGDNSVGQLGAGDAAVDGSLPAQVPGLGHVMTLSAGPDAQHQCAALDDGAVECWGNNDYGQVLGYQSGSDPLEVPVPTLVQGLPGPVSALAAGDHYTCAILADDDQSEIWCWGDWSAPSESRPTLLQGSVPSATSLSAGRPMCAVTNLGVECWGSNDWFALGTPDAGSSPVIQPQGLSGAGQVAMGNVHGCAVTNGQVLCWGLDLAGETGEDPTSADGGLVDIATPTLVQGLENDNVETSAGIYHSCARRAGGDVWCWGDLTSSYVPARMSDLSSKGAATHVFSGGHFACAVVGEAAYCWGYDQYGQIGNGEVVNEGTVPVTKVSL